MAATVAEPVFRVLTEELAQMDQWMLSEDDVVSRNYKWRGSYAAATVVQLMEVLAAMAVKAPCPEIEKWWLEALLAVALAMWWEMRVRDAVASGEMLTNVAATA